MNIEGLVTMPQNMPIKVIASKSHSMAILPLGSRSQTIPNDRPSPLAIRSSTHGLQKMEGIALPSPERSSSCHSHHRLRGT